MRKEVGKREEKDSVINPGALENKKEILFHPIPGSVRKRKKLWLQMLARGEKMLQPEKKKTNRIELKTNQNKK